ncbi:MAG TPA: hypothetical protein VHD90_20705 [Phototrophicaceae bacterium]|nr:hypothetical protein [Phototrophicaceae bacterium]
MASGFHVVDFLDLQPLERCVVRLILREVTMTYPQLCEAITTLPVDQQMDQPKLDTVLDQLTQNHWLVREYDHNLLSYRVNTSENTRRQTGLDLSELSRADDSLNLKRSKRNLPNHVWDCLTDAPAETPAPPKPARRTSLFDKFTDDENPPKET